jgi:hypothetical protein
MIQEDEMVNIAAKEIRVEQLHFPDEVGRRLASLAMSVEISGHKRFSVSKTVDHIIELINFSLSSTSSDVKSALSNLVSSLNLQQKSLLIGFGADFSVPEKPSNEPQSLDDIDRKYLRGARG